MMSYHGRTIENWMYRLRYRARSRRLCLGSRQHFTLIELLVVVSIIAILAALLLPALNRARDMAHRISCVNNLGSLGKAFLMYSDDYKGILPAYFNTAGDAWQSGCSMWWGYSPQNGTLAPYLGLNEKLRIGTYGYQYDNVNNPIGHSKFFCPKLDRLRDGKPHVWGYGYNYYVLKYSTRLLAKFATPSQTSLLNEIDTVNDTPGAVSYPRNFTYYTTNYIVYRHNNLANVLYAGGNVGGLKSNEEPPSYNATPRPPFWYAGDAVQN